MAPFAYGGYYNHGMGWGSGVYGWLAMLFFLVVVIMLVIDAARWVTASANAVTRYRARRRVKRRKTF